MIRRPLAPLLAAALVAAPPAVGQAPDDPTPDSLFFRGVVVDQLPGRATPEAFRFELRRADTFVVVTPLGQLDLDPTLGRFPELPAPPDSVVPFQLSADAFELVARTVDDALADAPPDDRFGLSVADGHVRLVFARGLRLSHLALGAAGAALAVAGATAAVFLARERRRARAGRDLQRRLVGAAEAERTRVAREIHDGPLQDLHAARAEPDPARAAAHVGAVAAELRAIAEGLRPPALGRFGLAAALHSHADRVAERHAVAVGVEADEDAPPLDPDAEASLFRVAQEAVANAVRHGGARSVRVSYAVDPPGARPRTVRLEVVDDGAGLPPGLDEGALAAAGHFGLTGMRERAALLGGRLAVTPAPGSTGAGPGAGPGTAIRLTVPLGAVTP